MKKIIYTVALFTCMATSSCSSFLEQDNKSDQTSKQFYATKTGFSNLLNTGYSSLRGVYGKAPWVFSAGTDLFASGKQGVNAIGLYGSSYNSSDGDVDDLYSECYKGIQLANSVLHYSATTEKTNVLNQFIDEARFLRAYYYYLLVQQFGGVALNTTMYDTAEMVHQRASAETVYNFVIEELNYLVSSSSQLLERSAAVGANFGRANKRAANHFLAKAYLARGYETFADSKDFENAAKYAELAINNEIPTIPFADVFNINNEQNNEIFWSVQYSSETLASLSADGNMQQSMFGVYLGGAEEKNKYNAGYLAPTYRLHQLYTEGDNRYEGTFMLEVQKYYYDYYKGATTSAVKYYYAPAWVDVDAWRTAPGFENLRKDAKVIVTQPQGPDRFGLVNTYADKCAQDYGVACIRKFDDPASPFSMTGSTHDVILARLGETYLVAAEAYVKLNQPEKAADKINKLRQRATKAGFNLTVTTAQVTGEAGIDFVLDERARECAGEYYRWMDLKRTGRLMQYVVDYNHDNIKAVAFVGNDGQNKILRPIPLDAINRNKGEVTQNPGF